MSLADVLRLERPLIVLDTETTGTNTDTDSIIELGLEIITPSDDGVRVKEYRTLINPRRPIPPGATAVHHITDDMVANAPTFEQLATNLHKGLSNVDFAGYNVRFDLRILATEFKRRALPWTYEGARVIDGFRLWQVACPRSLEDAANEFLDEETKDALAGEAHTALGDVRWSSRVIAAQLKRFAKLPRNVQQLHDLCNPNEFDADGKLKWRDGELCIAFGQHRDTPLRKVPAGYLKWMVDRDFSDKVRGAIRDAQRGVYPRREEA